MSGLFRVFEEPRQADGLHSGELVQREIVGRSSFLVERHMAIVDFQNHGCHGSAIEASARFCTVVTAPHVPATSLVARFLLAVDQEVAHFLVPLVPHFPFVLAKDLGRVVVVVHVVLARAGGTEILHTLGEGRILTLPTEVHAAQQAHCG